MRMFGKSSCRHSSCERGLLLSIFDFKRKKYRTFLQDSETGEEIAEEYEKGRGVWKKHDVQDGKDSEMREKEALLVFGESAGSWISLSGLLYCQFFGGYRLGEK